MFGSSVHYLKIFELYRFRREYDLKCEAKISFYPSLSNSFAFNFCNSFPRFIKSLLSSLTLFRLIFFPKLSVFPISNSHTEEIELSFSSLGSSFFFLLFKKIDRYFARFSSSLASLFFFKGVRIVSDL